MRADGFGGTGGSDRHVRDVENGLGGMAQQPDLGVADVDVALDPDDGGHVRLPVGVGQLAFGVEDGDGAALVVAVGRAERFHDGRDSLDLLVQGWLGSVSV